MKAFLRVLGYIFHYKALVFLAVICSLMYAAMNGFSAYLIGPFMKTLFSAGGEVSNGGAVAVAGEGAREGLKYSFQKGVNDILGTGEPVSVLGRLCLVIIVVIVIKNLFSYFQGYIMAYVEQGVVRDLREDVYMSYHRLPLRYFQKRKTGDLISRVINDCHTVNTNLNASLINMMKEPINMAVLLGLMIVLSWRLTAYTFIVAPPCLIVINRIGRKLRRRTTRTQDRISDMTSVLGETINNIRVVKAFAMERFEIEKFRKANYSYFRSLLKLFWMKRLASPLTEVLGVAVAVAVLWIGGKLVLEHRGLAPEHFLEFILMMFLLMQSAKRLSEVHVKLQVGIAATDRIFEVIDLPGEIEDPPDPRPLEGVNRGISFDGVWYEYEPGEPVLRDISLDVAAGENVAIVGPSGGGKSTLVDLLPRFFDPTSGSVRIDGTDISQFRLDDLRSLFGIVTQETMLFHDTIRANIAYGRPDIPPEDVKKAAKTAYAHDFIMKLENGYDTVVGERGMKLSGGQKQRLAIARAILKNPPILIFDEATSALDSESEAEVQAAIDRLLEGRTSFVIAHRLSTIQKATRIVVIDEGRIVEIGSHRELYEKGGIYRRLSDIQFAQKPE